jgi:hypothetical protein
MKPKKLMFKEVKIPTLTILFLSIGIILFLSGAVCNFLVIQGNQGKMPVNFEVPYTMNESVYSSETHFQITSENLYNISYLGFADLYHIKSWILSIGDLLMGIGLLFLIMAIIPQASNNILKIIITIQKRRGRNVRSR